MTAGDKSDQLKPPTDFIALSVMPHIALIDARRLKCPLPVLRLARALKEASKRRFVLCATDAATLTDIPAFCAARGLDLEKHILIDGYYWFSINAE